MAHDSMFDDWTSTRTFASKDRLMKALEKDGLEEEFFLVVRTGTAEGRWTAIFSNSRIVRDGNTTLMHVIDCGFKVMN